jgi:hypothetical protein
MYLCKRLRMRFLITSQNSTALLTYHFVSCGHQLAMYGTGELEQLHFLYILYIIC